MDEWSEREFDEPATDSVVHALLAVSGELLVTRARCKRLELLLVEKGLASPDEIDGMAERPDYQDWLANETADFTKFTFLQLAGSDDGGIDVCQGSS